MRINKFEIAVIGFLLIGASIRAVSGLTSLPLVTGHAITLLALFIVCQSLAAKISYRGAGLFFAFTALLLIVEIAIQILTGLHVNWFVISLLLEGNLKQNTGMSAPLLGSLLVAATLGLYWTNTKFSGHTIKVIAPRIIFMGAVAAAVTQLIYAVAFYQGSTEAIQVRRNIPFFWTPHPYQSNKLLSYVFGPRGENPFSLSKVRPEDAVYTVGPPVLTPLSQRAGAAPPNILLIVTDSLRSKDIKADPELAPTLMSASGQNGYLSLDHYSVSNCTHFSLYSMFTGNLPTSYGTARARKAGTGMFAEISAAGYSLTTAESVSLDWYDLSDIILPTETERWIGNEDEDTLESDRQVTLKTIEQLKKWKQTGKPGIHLAYYFGTHFPYSEALGSAEMSRLDLYKTAIGLFDIELAKILDALNQQGLDDNTLVIVTSDHGEEFYENGRVGHASRLSDEQVQVPLLVLGTQNQSLVPPSQRGIPELIYSTIEPSRAQSQPPKSIYLANCGYDFPEAFAVLNKNGRFDFTFDNGYLIPSNSLPDGQQANMRKAAADLLKSIE